MTRSSLQDVSGLTDPLLSYNFDLIFPRIPGFSGNTQPLTIKCQSSTLPGMQLEAVPLSIHGVEVSYAGRQIWTKTFNATFIETRDGATRASMRAWMRYARNNVDNQGHYKNGSDGYAVNPLMYLYDDIPNIIDQVQIFGVFPTNMEDITMDGSQGSIVTTSMTYSFDYTQESLDQ